MTARNASRSVVSIFVLIVSLALGLTPCISTAHAAAKASKPLPLSTVAIGQGSRNVQRR